MLILSPQALATYVKDEREKQKLTQAQLAAKVGLRQKTISDFENSPHKTRIETLFKILAALHHHMEVAHIQNSQNSSWKEEW